MTLLTTHIGRPIGATSFKQSHRATPLARPIREDEDTIAWNNLCNRANTCSRSWSKLPKPTLHDGAIQDFASITQIERYFAQPNPLDVLDRGLVVTDIPAFEAQQKTNKIDGLSSPWVALKIRGLDAPCSIVREREGWSAENIFSVSCFRALLASAGVKNLQPIALSELINSVLDDKLISGGPLTGEHPVEVNCQSSLLPVLQDAYSFVPWVFNQADAGPNLHLLCTAVGTSAQVALETGTYELPLWDHERASDITVQSSLPGDLALESLMYKPKHKGHHRTEELFVVEVPLLSIIPPRRTRSQAPQKDFSTSWTINNNKPIRVAILSYEPTVSGAFNGSCAFSTEATMRCAKEMLRKTPEEQEKAYGRHGDFVLPWWSTSRHAYLPPAQR